MQAADFTLLSEELGHTRETRNVFSDHFDPPNKENAAAAYPNFPLGEGQTIKGLCVQTHQRKSWSCLNTQNPNDLG